VITERLYQFRVICRVGSELLSILEGSADMVLLDNDIAHLSLFKLRHEVAKDQIILTGMTGKIKQVKEHDHKETDENPQGKIFETGIHPNLLNDTTPLQNKNFYSIIFFRP
jgi:hypothetical protein